MINPIKLFTSFSGRIPRLWFWVGLCTLAAISPFSIWSAMRGNPFAKGLELVRSLGVAGLLWAIVLLLPLAALMVKRLHDRGKSGIYALLFYLPAFLTTLRALDFNPPQLAQFEYWLSWVIWWTGAAGLFFLIDLGFFGSKSGSNKYGPQPGAREA